MLRTAGGLCLDVADNAFDRARARVGVVAAPAAAALALALGEGGEQTKLAALFLFAGILWICESIPAAVTALVAVAGSVVLGIATAKQAFAALGNPILFLFVGSFMIAEAMNVHGLGARFARAVARIGRGRLGALVTTSFAAWAMSLWISNAASTAVVLPIALAVARTVDDRRYSAAMVLAIAWGASVGGLGTPVGTPPNLIGVRALKDMGLDVSFAKWMAFGVPIAAVMLVVLWIVLAIFFRVRPGGPPIAASAGASGPWSAGERASATAFGVAVAFWVGPSILDLLGVPGAAFLKERLPEEVVAILAASILFLWPLRAGPRARALTWDDAARIDWGTVLLFGGGVLLGDLANKTGLAAAWGEALVRSTGAQSTLALVALVTAAALVLSELASNTASATLMVPLAIGVAQAANVPVLPVALGATIGASFGFMMPISTAPNAMAYGTRQVSIRQMASAGILFDVVGFFVVVAGVLLVSTAFGP